MFVSIITCIIFSNVQAIDKCSNDGHHVNPEYYLVKQCHRSKLTILAKANLAKLSECKQFALEKKGLSFNFSPQISRVRSLKNTCEVMQCAEISESQFSKNSRYDYYSVIGNLSLVVNTTCVPSLGMFHFISKKINYSKSLDVCYNKSGILADVTSEDRTNALAKVLSDAGFEEAFINLKRENSSDFIASNGDLLECTPYRAWAPGHPRERGKSDCVTLTRRRTWRSVSCEKRLAALCELIPGKSIVKPYLSLI